MALPMGHSRGTYNRSNNVVALAQACAREKKAKKARARCKKSVLWPKNSNTRAFWAFWSCVLFTLAWLCYACLCDI